jgi:hypothetical protein
MMLGLFAGNGLAVILYLVTRNAVYFGLAGVGLALGLGIGAALDRARGPEKHDREAQERSTRE